MEFQKEHQNAIVWLGEQCSALIDGFSRIPTANIPRQRHSRNIWTALFRDFLGCLYEMASYLPLEHVLVDHSRLLVELLLSWGVFQGEPPPREPDAVEDRMHFEYGLALGEFGDDLPSLLTIAIVELTR